MDYKEKYEKALETARLLVSNSDDEICKKKIEGIFPKLIESEDDRIRRNIINFLTYGVSIADLASLRDREECIAWLEKQTEQKSAISDETINKMVSRYRDTPEEGNQNFGFPVSCMIRAYRQGLRDAINTFGLQKHAEWSEEDEKMLNSILSCLRGQIDSDVSMTRWLKSLKPKSHWKPSEKQVNSLERAMDCLMDGEDEEGGYERDD